MNTVHLTPSSIGKHNLRNIFFKGTTENNYDVNKKKIETFCSCKKYTKIDVLLLLIVVLCCILVVHKI